MEIILDNVTYKYPNTEKEAVKNITLKITKGKHYFIIGENGSGKTTLLEILAGLISIDKGLYTLKNIKKEEVGIVFQNPEIQFFQESVYKEMAIALKYKKIDEKIILEKIKEIVFLFNMDFEKIKDLSPYDLSGGEKRKVAIMTFLLLEPKVLILDEPSVALDPVSRTELMKILKEVQRKRELTIIQSTHLMDEVAKYSDYIIALKNGEIKMEGKAKKIFYEEEKLKKINLGIPEIIKTANLIRNMGIKIDNIISVEELKNNIMKLVKIKND